MEKDIEVENIFMLIGGTITLMGLIIKPIEIPWVLSIIPIMYLSISRKYYLEKKNRKSKLFPSGYVSTREFLYLLNGRLSNICIVKKIRNIRERL